MSLLLNNMISYFVETKLWVSVPVVEVAVAVAELLWIHTGVVDGTGALLSARLCPCPVCVGISWPAHPPGERCAICKSQLSSVMRQIQFFLNKSLNTLMRTPSVHSFESINTFKSENNQHQQWTLQFAWGC